MFRIQRPQDSKAAIPRTSQRKRRIRRKKGGRRRTFYLYDPKTKEKTKLWHILDGLGKICMEKYDGGISTTVVERYHSRLQSLFKTREKMPVLLRLLRWRFKIWK